jgi:tetratricopeptide (TPR) repeat protein
MFQMPETFDNISNRRCTQGADVTNSFGRSIRYLLFDSNGVSARAISIFGAISVLFTTVASSQDPRDWNECIGREGPNIDLVVHGCTAVIEAAQEGPVKLALAFNNRGVARRLQGEYDLALQDYNEAIRLNPTSAAQFNNRGVIYRIKGNYDQAIADYGQAIALRNDYPAAFYNRALAYADKGAFDSALADFAIVLRFDPRNALALYARGLMLLKNGDAEAGRRDIDAAKRINPDIADQYDQSETPMR